MSKRTNSRLERRAERDARRPSAAPRPQRRRPVKAPSRTGGSIPWVPIVAIVAAGALIAVLAYAVISANSGGGEASWQKAQLDASSSIPGTYIKPNPGPDGKFPTGDDRQHFGTGVKWPICSDAAIVADAAITDVTADRSGVANCYNSNPPTSGPHANPGPMPFKVLENPAPKENLVHNMEHSGVVVWYNTDNQDAIKQLAAIVQGKIDRNRLVVMSRYTEMEPDTIALTSWTRLDKFKVSELDKNRVENFIDKNQRRFNPEGF